MMRFATAATIVALILATPVIAQAPRAIAQETAVPRIATQNGRHALIVDGEPFLMLGGQVNNASNYASQLPMVWPTLKRIYANTVEVPVAWQQVEAEEGRFDFTFVQTLLDQARENDMRVVLLWFGTWKNTGLAYTPDWVKLDDRRFPRMRRRDGSPQDVLTPLAQTTLAADRAAFVALIGYLKMHDPQNTVIMVQVENETGSYANPRDYSPAADRLFAGPVPALLARALDKPAGTWTQMFGAQADRAFNTWYVARYVDALAVAGKAVKPLPMYVNASLAGPTGIPDPMGVASGGPQQDVLPIWKAAAPAIDLAAPDIYDRKAASVAAYLDAYRRPDNALMVPEIGNARDYARFFWAALGHGAIGFAPFGMDTTGYYNYPLGAKTLDDATLDAFARNYRPFAANMRAWARIAFEHPTWGVAKPDDGAAQSTTMGNWTITASYNEWQFGQKDATWIKTDPTPWANDPVGGAVVAQLSADSFLISGDHVRLSFAGRKGGPANAMILRVEEGHFDGDAWVMERIWNGDLTDYGINFIDHPVLLKVTMGHYR